MKIFESSECALLCKSIETKRFFNGKYISLFSGAYMAYVH